MSFIDNFEKYKIEIIENGVKLPNFDTGNIPPDKFLFDLCIKGLETRLGGKKHPKYKEYYDRMIYELGVLNELGFCEYLLITWDILNFCKKNNIATGYGRGSAAGSLVLWLVGVTEIDSLKYDLYFERFLNKTRAKFKEINGTKYYAGSLLFDVDLDISFSDRYKVIDYLNTKYSGKTAKLLTVSTLTTKILLKEVCKSYLEYSEDQANEISEMILKEHGKVKSIKESIEKSADFKNFCEQNPKVIQISGRLSELIKNCGIHPSACIINHINIDEVFPLQLTKDKEIVTGYTMDDSLELAIKVDILGIRAATLLNEICKMLNLDINKIDLNDKIIYDNLQNLITPHGLFQIEAETNYRVLQKVKPKNLDHLAAIVSLARPGVLQFTDQYAKYVETGEFQSVHPFFDDILKSTAGIPLYQESLLTMAKKIGFSLVEGETLRRLVGKKKLEEVKEWQEKIQNKIKENKLDPEIGEEFWKLLEASANYSFNASHAYSYASMCAATVYMKFKYPREFYLCLLKLTKDEPNPIEEISKIQKELQFFGIKLLPPDLVKSELDFIINQSDIQFGLASIKGISDKSIQKLLNFKNKYSNKFQIFAGATSAKIPSNVFSSIIMSGGMDNMLTESRSKTYFEYIVWKELTTTEKKYVLELGPKYDYNLFNIVKDLNEKIKDEKGKPIIKTSRRDTIKKHINPHWQLFRQNSKNQELANYYFETSLLGFSFSTTLKQIFSKFCNDLIDIQEINQSLDNENVHFAAEVVEAKKFKSKAKKTPTLKIVCKDNTGQINVLMFNTVRGSSIDNCEENNGRLPKEGDLVVIRGQKKSDCIFARSISIQDVEIFRRISEIPKSTEKSE